MADIFELSSVSKSVLPHRNIIRSIYRIHVE